MATVKRRILDDQTFKEQTNTTNRMLASIAKAVAGGGGSLDVDDVVEFATLLGAGVGQICSIGKQFHIPKETSVTVGTDKVEGSTLAVTINEDAFLAAMGHAEERAFEAEYDGAVWHWVDKAAGTVILADYGITATGTPKEGDKIVIVESASRIAWDLMQYNPAGYTLLHDTTGRGDSALLYAHKIQSYGTIPFCPAKLLYYTQNGMPAGTYKFTLYKAAYASGAAYDGDYVFTLTQPIPAYGGFRIPGIGGWKQSYAKTDVTSAKVTTYTGKYNNATHVNTFEGRGTHIRSNAIETNVAIAEYTNQAYNYDLGTFTSQRADYYTEEDTVNTSFGGKRGRTEHNAYGDNRFSRSTFLIWGNSTAPKATGDGLGNWFFYRDDFDLPPSASACNMAGYLHGYGQDFLDAVQTVKFKCALPACYSATNVTSYEEVETKFFPLSKVEIDGGEAVSGQDEGERLDYFKMHSTADDRKKLNGSSYAYYFSRSANADTANTVWSVYASGSFNTSGAYDGYGFVPACIIKKSA